MAQMTMELNVEVDGGTEYKVVADQRDIAKWEVQPFGCPFTEVESKALSWMRFLAWSASFRQQITTLKFEAWNDTCIEVTPIDDEDDADPLEGGGQTKQSASPTSPLLSGPELASTNS